MRSDARLSRCWSSTCCAFRLPDSASSAFLPREGTLMRHRAAPHAPQVLAQRVGLGRRRGHENLGRDRVGGVVRLLKQAPSTICGRLKRLGLVDHPSALARDAPVAHVEHVRGRLQLVVDQAEDVRRRCPAASTIALRSSTLVSARSRSLARAATSKSSRSEARLHGARQVADQRLRVAREHLAHPCPQARGAPPR